MKYFLTCCIMLSLAVSAKSQWWFDFGVKGAYGPTLMYDKNVFDSATYKHKLTAGSAFGAKLGFNYGYHVGINFEYSAATMKQDFNLNSKVYNSFKIKHNDVLALFRYSGNGAYFEVGGSLAKIKKAELDNVNAPGIEDKTPNFSKNYASGVLGFGSYLAGGEFITLNLGIRLHFAVDDMVSPTGKEGNYPIIVYPLPDPTRKTLATAAQLQAELNVAFGRFSKTACHDRWRLLFFQ